jgi:hypothetical protein
MVKKNNSRMTGRQNRQSVEGVIQNKTVVDVHLTKILRMYGRMRPSECCSMKKQLPAVLFRKKLTLHINNKERNNEKNLVCASGSGDSRRDGFCGLFSGTLGRYCYGK